jgi:hypothetical protein
VLLELYDTFLLSFYQVSRRTRKRMTALLALPEIASGFCQHYETDRENNELTGS